MEEKKLKTLKDILFEDCTIHSDINYVKSNIKYVTKDKLEETAKEWIKAIEDKRKKDCPDFDFDTREWIKVFFNLVEENKP